MQDLPSNPSDAAAQPPPAAQPRTEGAPRNADRAPRDAQAAMLRTRIDDIADALRAAPGAEAALQARLLAQRAAGGTGAAVRDSVRGDAKDHAQERIGARGTRAPAAAPAIAQPPGEEKEFLPDMSPCATHGPYPINLRDARGVLRYLPLDCPGCRKQKAADALLRRAAIAPRFAACSFDNYVARTPHQQEAFDTCRAYARDFARMREQGTCLILRGNPGTGKNHLASAIAKAVVARGMSVANATAGEIVGRVRETWRAASGETEEAVIREFAALDLLIIDEVGRQYASRDGNDGIELFNVIDQRYRRVAPTVIISNCRRDDLREALGHAAFDRLREGGGRLANFDWETYRR